METKFKIAIIMTWFGDLPEYFPYWLKSAEANETIDFYCICDREIRSDAPNIKYISTTLQEEVRRYGQILGRSVEITAPYKFCDCRVFFGILYEELLKGYDFWGYCDIDLVFGDLRKFITDDVLEKYDRIYKNGHLSLYRNNEYINHLFELPGSIYSLDEIFTSPAKMTYEEFYGINRICKLNDIAWYTEKDFVDFRPYYPNRMERTNSLDEPKHQVFYWENGATYCAYEIAGQIETEEYAYLHFQKRRMRAEKKLVEQKEIRAFYVCPQKLILKAQSNVLTIELMDKINPPMSNILKRAYNLKFMFERLKRFVGHDSIQKKIKLREKRIALLDKLRKF